MGYEQFRTQVARLLFPFRPRAICPRCHRWVKRTVGEIAAKSDLPRDMRLDEMPRRLRCDCGGRPVVWGI